MKIFQIMQQDTDQLHIWAENWTMDFKPDKYEELHTGRSNVWGTSTVGSRNLGSNDLQCYPRVQVHSSMEVATQIE